MRRQRRTLSADLRAKVTIAASKCDAAPEHLADQLKLHLDQIIRFGRYAHANIAELLERGNAPKPTGISGDGLKDLRVQIGQLTFDRVLGTTGLPNCFRLPSLMSRSASIN